jgi:hypothetical protein
MASQDENNQTRSDDGQNSLGVVVSHWFFPFNPAKRAIADAAPVIPEMNCPNRIASFKAQRLRLARNGVITAGVLTLYGAEVSDGFKK